MRGGEASRALGEPKRCWAAEGDAGEPKSSGVSPPAALHRTAPQSPARHGPGPVRPGHPRAPGWTAPSPRGSALQKKGVGKKEGKQFKKGKGKKSLFSFPPKLWSCTTAYSYRSSAGKG